VVLTVHTLPRGKEALGTWRWLPAHETGIPALDLENNTFDKMSIKIHEWHGLQIGYPKNELLFKFTMTKTLGCGSCSSRGCM
jgi:hypothetical protein